jgi:hypothetical protein
VPLTPAILEIMILSAKITIVELSKKGKTHKWEKNRCEKCQRNMWGHGFVARYFAEVMSAVYLKRYRCPGCSVVVTSRPETHWKGIRSSISAIYDALKCRLTGFWPPGFPRQRGLHWLRRFVTFAKMENQQSLPLFLEYCLVKQIHFFT